MPVISFAKKNREPLTVAENANLMKSLLEGGLPVASSCHGDGVCGKCRIEILTGRENLSAMNETEKFLREKYQLPPSFRISCQTEILGDITIHASYW